MSRRVFCLALLSSVLGFGATCRAEEGAARLDFGAPESCPQLLDFTREIESRLSRGRLARSGEMARTFHVRVRNDSEKSVAKLTFTDADGRIAEREVSAQSCEEATRAIAIVTALAIDARAEEEAKAHPAPTPVPTPPPAATTPAPVPAPAPLPKTSAETPLVLGVGAEAGVERGFAPGFVPRVAALVELGTEAFSVRLGLSYADSGPVEADRGKARYRLYSARASAWPLLFTLSEGFGLGVGAGFDLGLVHAAGERSDRIDHPRSQNKPWFVPFAVGRVELRVDPALAFHLDGLAGFPVTRHEFVLDEDIVIHQVPSVTPSLAVGLLGRFR
jgi:hypothetical protein